MASGESTVVEQRSSNRFFGQQPSIAKPPHKGKTYEERRRKLEMGFRGIGRLDTVIEGLESLYELRDETLTDIDTRDMPEVPFVRVQSLTDDIPELLKVFLSDQRIGEYMGSFECMLKFLKTRPHAWQYADILFGHQSVQDLVDSKEKLIKLYEFKPVKMGAIFQKYPEQLLSKNLKTTDNLIEFIQHMPSIRRYTLFYNLDCLKSAQDVLRVLQWMPEVANDLLFKRRYHLLFTTDAAWFELVQAVPDVVSLLSDPKNLCHQVYKKLRENHRRRMDQIETMLAKDRAQDQYKTADAKRFLTQFLADCKDKPMAFKVAYCETNKARFELLLHEGLTYLKLILNAHPELVFEILSKINLTNFRLHRQLKLFLMDLFNQVAESRAVIAVMSFTKVFTHGLPGCIESNIELARSSLLLAHKEIKITKAYDLDVSQSVKMEQLKLKRTIDDSIKKEYQEKNTPKTTTVRPIKSLQKALEFTYLEKLHYDRYCHAIFLFGQMRAENVPKAKQKLIEDLKKENIFTLLKMAEKNAQIYQLCQDPHMAEYWQYVLDDLWRNENRYSMVGDAFKLAMGELLFREYQIWDYHGYNHSNGAALVLKLAIEKYRSPSAVLELYEFYMRRLKNTGPKELVDKSMISFIEQCANEYWSLGLVLAVDMCWELARHFGPKHPDYSMYLSCALKYLICAEHFQADIDSLSILQDIPINIAYAQFPSFNAAKDFLYDSLREDHANVACVTESVTLQSMTISHAHREAELLIDQLTRLRDEKLVESRNLAQKLAKEPKDALNIELRKDFRAELSQSLLRKYGIELGKLEVVVAREFDALERRWSL